jgi:hypothetical protein
MLQVVQQDTLAKHVRPLLPRMHWLEAMKYLIMAFAEEVKNREVMIP